MSVLPLTALDLGVAALLLLAAGGVSLALQLGLERRLGIAALRTVIQLLLVGYILKEVFALDNALVVVAIMILMTIMAGRAAVQRPTRTFSGATWRAFATLVLCGLTTTFVVTKAVIHIDPWYDPQYLIPILGMILGNGLTGISLCLDQMLEQLTQKRAQIEMELAHGATRWEAGREVMRDSVRRGMIPIINSMMVVGIVALPGMMTGQILAGVPPHVAVRYQIVVMFMIAAATSLGCIMIALLVFFRLFNAKHQLVTGAVRPQGKH